MRIGIDAGPIVGGAGGIGTHTFHVLRSMLRLNRDLDVFAYIPKGSSSNIRPDDWASFYRLRWIEVDRWGWSAAGARDRLDLFHGPNFKLRAEGRFGGVVTIHDLWLDRHPEYSGKFLGQWWSGVRTKRTAWRAKKVITVSEFSKREIVELYGLPPERVVVIPNGVSREFWGEQQFGGPDAVARTLTLPDRPYVLFVGGADPRKNHRGFLKAFAHRRDDLKPCVPVLVGDPVHRFGSYLETARSLELDREVVCIGRVGPGALRSFYRKAEMLVFPSLYEGFGIPVLEAMACGTPVITSSTSSLPEVAGAAAFLIDPEDPVALGDAMVRVLRDEPLRAELRAKGYERVKQFDWTHAAEKTLELYAALCA